MKKTRHGDQQFLWFEWKLYLSYVNRLVKGLSKRLLQIDRKIYSCIFIKAVDHKSRHSNLRLNDSLLSMHVTLVIHSLYTFNHIENDSIVIYLKTTFQDFLSFGTAHGTMNGNFFITTNTEWTNGVTCFWENWLLTSQLFQHLQWKHNHNNLRLEFCLVFCDRGTDMWIILHSEWIKNRIKYLSGSCKSVTRFTNANVQAQFTDMQIAHHILSWIFLDFFGRISLSRFNSGRL